MRSVTLLAIGISLLSVPCARGQETGAAEVSPTTLQAVRHRPVSSRKPDGMILSEGNLYFTSHDAAGAAVWRTAQSSVPGQETVLYWEPGARFGDIVFAKVNGAFFGYFLATKGDGTVVTIKRVSLTGGPATVLATLPTIDLARNHRNLITDEINLYWQQDTAVLKMPVGGGPITVLDRTSPTGKPTAGLAVQGNRIIYATGNEIHFVPKIGAITSPAIRTLVTAGDRVTTLQALIDTIFWGELNGAIRMKVGTTITSNPSSTAGLAPTSIFIPGATVPQAWTQCGSQSCLMHINGSIINNTFPIGADAFGVSVNSDSDVFWGDALGIHRPDIATDARLLPRD